MLYIRRSRSASRRGGDTRSAGPKGIAVNTTYAYRYLPSGATLCLSLRRAPRAVLLSIEEYEGLVAKIPDPLEALRGEFDALVDRMQTPQARKAVDALFSATPGQLGDAAVKDARRRRRG